MSDSETKRARIVAAFVNLAKECDDARQEELSRTSQLQLQQVTYWRRGLMAHGWNLIVDAVAGGYLRLPGRAGDVFECLQKPPVLDPELIASGDTDEIEYTTKLILEGRTPERNFSVIASELAGQFPELFPNEYIPPDTDDGSLGEAVPGKWCAVGVFLWNRAAIACRLLAEMLQTPTAGEARKLNSPSLNDSSGFTLARLANDTQRSEDSLRRSCDEAEPKVERDETKRGRVFTWGEVLRIGNADVRRNSSTIAGWQPFLEQNASWAVPLLKLPTVAPRPQPSQ